MSRPTVYRRYRNWAPAIFMNVFILGFTGFSQADKASSYESYFGDEVTSATCDGTCIEEWGLKRPYICQLSMNDLNYREVPEFCEI